MPQEPIGFKTPDQCKIIALEKENAILKEEIAKLKAYARKLETENEQLKAKVAETKAQDVPPSRLIPGSPTFGDVGEWR